MNVASCLLLVSCWTFAEDSRTCSLMQTLPPDGSWVSFDLKIDVDGREIRTIWTTRSVGRIQYQGKPCRIIELEQTCTGPIEPVYGIVPITDQCWRAVIPEDEFGLGKYPLGRAVRVWVQSGASPPESVTSIAARDAIVDALSRGPSANLVSASQPETIAGPRGELSCDVVKGVNQTEFAGLMLRLEHRVLNNKEVPFGVAGSRQAIKAGFGGTDYPANLELKLRDYGQAAQAKLPGLAP